jgi:hypothetical protein
MAGLSKRFCRQACPWRTQSDIRGMCGLCSGKCQPCDEDGNNCGEWQDCQCSAEGTSACGDGHNCHRYIDIEFTLDAFVIQGKVCTNASGVSITQQCTGGRDVPYGGDFTNTPVAGTPSGWSSMDNGTNDYVIYEKTVHRLRLTRQDCGCFWGGYWSSSCDCRTCCCTDEATSEYPDCDVTSCFPAIGDCFDQEASDKGCRACDPSNPCVPIDDGYASSLDTYGTGEVGGSDGEAVCVSQSYRSTQGGVDPCDYIATDCDTWIDDDTNAFAGWEVGEFKPHHIEAYFSYKVDSLDNCNSGWILEIRGLTELSRSELGLAGSYPALDCLGGEVGGVGCQQSNGGSADGALGYRGRWWGLASGCDFNGHCVDGTTGESESAIGELAFHSCSCPPSTDIESTVRVTNALAAFHPSSVYASEGGDANSGFMHTCVVNDAQGNNEPAEYCNNDDYVATIAPPCLGKQYISEGDFTEGTCYGTPDMWWNECNDAQPADGFEGGEGIPNDVYPCQHCVSGTDPNGLNHYSCNPCPTSGESRACAPCNIKIRPNSSEQPWWAGGT